MSFNDNQLRAINVKNKNVLVNAGAGSGKTRVLVEKIVQQITEENININNILALTFTKSAANEMKNRIKSSIIERINVVDEKDKEKLILELNNIQNANISTIDSFCKKIVDENFSKIDDLDPNYRIADEKEINLIIDDCIDKHLNYLYDNCDADKNLERFLKCYYFKDDATIKSMFKSGIIYLQKKIDSELYLKELLKDYDKKQKNYFYNEIVEYYKNKFKDCMDIIKNIDFDNLYKLLLNNYKSKKRDSLEKYLNQLDHSKKIIDVIEKKLKVGLSEKTDFSNINIDDNYFKYTSNALKSLKQVMDVLIIYIKEYNTELSIYNYIQTTGFDNEKIYIENLQSVNKLFLEYKLENNILEISDLQKYAIKLLAKYDEKKQMYVWTDIAKVLQKKYKYIYIDEYQDTSEVQELLVKSLSDNYQNLNVFFVGDIKQSIYGFRNAKPKIFNEKLQNFKTYEEDSSCVNECINLKENYRCDENIIKWTNKVFSKIMTKNYSDIDYNNQKLVYKKCDVNVDNDKFKNLNKNIEINICFSEDKKNEQNEKVINKFSKVEEAQVIAKRIKKLHEEDNVEFKDIVILVRALKDISNIYIKEFSKYNIPIVAELKTGFFTSFEIEFMIDVLSIIDNPINDLTLMSVLKSKIYNINENEITFLKYIYSEFNINNKFFSLYNIIKKIYEIDKNNTNIENIAEDEKEFSDLNEYLYCIFNNKKSKYVKGIKKYDVDIELLKNKIDVFMENMSIFRQYARYKNISELINIVYNTIDIYDYVSSMSGGKIRVNNLNLLLNVAKSYESTSYYGLFNFIKFIEKMKERKEDSASAQVFSKNENVVRMMTIHNSKGLEFPIVIMPNLDASYHKPSSKNSPVYFDDDFGPNLNFIDYENRVSFNSYKRKKYLVKNKYEEKKEEQRLMYVAFTRAKEKLIFSLKIKSEKNLNEFLAGSIDEMIYDNQYIDSINDYSKFLKAGFNADIIKQQNNNYIDLNIIKLEDILNENNVVENKNTKIENDYIDEDLQKMFNKNIMTKYPYEDIMYKNPKYSVSQIKQKLNNNNVKTNKINNLNDNIEQDDDDLLFDLNNNKVTFDGTDVGNIYHKFMKNFDFKNIKNIPKEIDPIHIEKLLNSSIGQQMKNAYELKQNKYFTEKKFMKLFKYDEIINYKKEANKFNVDVLNELDDELKNIKNVDYCDIIIQGIIDAFYIINNKDNKQKIILVDYKTDGITSNKKLNEKYFINNYKIQMDIYAKALSDITKLEVEKKYIYSFALDKEIEIL